MTELDKTIIKTTLDDLVNLIYRTRIEVENLKDVPSEEVLNSLARSREILINQIQTYLFVEQD